MLVRRFYLDNNTNLSNIKHQTNTVIQKINRCYMALNICYININRESSTTVILIHKQNFNELQNLSKQKKV